MSHENEPDEGQPELPFEPSQGVLLSGLSVQYLIDKHTGEPSVSVDWVGETEDQDPPLLLLLGMIEFARDSVLRTYRSGE